MRTHGATNVRKFVWDNNIERTFYGRCMNISHLRYNFTDAPNRLSAVWVWAKFPVAPKEPVGELLPNAENIKNGRFTFKYSYQSMVFKYLELLPQHQHFVSQMADLHGCANAIVLLIVSYHSRSARRSCSEGTLGCIAVSLWNRIK